MMSITTPRLKTQVLIAVCIVFLWGAAANVPLVSTGCVGGVPFLIALFLILWRYRTRTKAIIWLVALLPLVCTLSVDMSRSRLFFPAIGTRIEVPAGWGGIEYHDNQHELQAPYLNPKNPFANTQSMLLVKVIPFNDEQLAPHPGLLAVLENKENQQYILDSRFLIKSVHDGRLSSKALESEHFVRPILNYFKRFNVLVSTAFSHLDYVFESCSQPSSLNLPFIIFNDVSLLT